MPCKLSARLRSSWRPCQSLLLKPAVAPYSSVTARYPRPRWPRPILQYNQQHRLITLSSIPTLLLPPVVFTGLLLTLWTYKCLMMIIFQNKIIYMPGMPPFSRSEKLEDYTNACKPTVWTEHGIKSGDGTQLKMLEGKIPFPITNDNNSETKLRNLQQLVVVLYLQGNASSLPPRLPYLSTILKFLHHPTSNTQYSIVALSYRGFWKSKGRPSQHGIQLDAQAALSWISQQHQDISSPSTPTKLVIWGQSIGAGVATTALATWLTQNPGSQSSNKSPAPIPVSGLLLETPFTSLRAMLIALYPQKFLPYRYLGPFLMSTWDSEDALARIGSSLAGDRRTEKEGDVSERLKVLLLEAENDELVPKEDATTLYTLCKEHEMLDVEHKIVAGALHSDVMMKSLGKKEIVRFLRGFET